MTRDIAQAVSWDAANRSMRTAGRKTWNEEDADVAAAEFNRLWPLCPHQCEPGDCWMCEASSKP